MPEKKLLKAPATKVQATDRQGNPVDPAIFAGKFVKTARKYGRRIAVRIEGCSKQIIFQSSVDYEACIQREFAPPSK